MDKFIVHDNFFSQEQLNNMHKIINSKQWTWGHCSNGKRMTVVCSPFWNMDLKKETYFSKYLTEIFEDILEKRFDKKFQCSRVYANGQTYGQSGSFHVDNERENTYTVLLYLSKLPTDVQTSGDGYTFFKIPSLKYDIAYAPVYNRVLIFPSNIFHKGGDYNRFLKDIRITVAWKFEEKI